MVVHGVFQIVSRNYCYLYYYKYTATGWTTADSPDEEQLKELGDKMNKAINAVHGKSYTSLKSIELYKTTGTASDWSVYS